MVDERERASLSTPSLLTFSTPFSNSWLPTAPTRTGEAPASRIARAAGAASVAPGWKERAVRIAPAGCEAPRADREWGALSEPGQRVGPPAASGSARSLPGGVPGHRRGVGNDLHLVWREPDEDQTGGHFGLAVEAAMALPRVDLDHGEARGQGRQTAMLA